MINILKRIKYAVIFLVLLITTGCSPKLIQALVTDSQAKMALNIALNQLGKKYTFGARGPDEFDCSGLITWAYKQSLNKSDIFRVGHKTTSDVPMIDLYKWNIQLISHKEMNPGDIIFIANIKGEITHGGLFVRWIDTEVFEFINASSYFGKVVLDTWPIEGIKREQRFVGAGRLKTVIK